jgi:hypothetical protein
VADRPPCATYGASAGTPERSYYSALENLLDAIGADLKGQALCVPGLGNTGAGHPDSFWEPVSTPRKAAERIGRAIGQHLMRAHTVGGAS